MRLAVAMAIVALGLGGCATRTYTSNLAFDVSQQAYVQDATTQAVVVSPVVAEPQRSCTGRIVC